MALFEQFPYVNFHGVNLSWILDTIRDHETRIHSLEDWKIVTDGRLDSLEGRMTTAEGDIDALEGRMTTAESDIDALEGRMDSAEDDIAALEGRMDTAETDIDRLETQVPSATAGDAGKVLTATGAGAASWQDIPKELPATLGTAGQVLTVNPAATGVEWTYPVIYVDYDAVNVPDPDVYIPMINRGQMVVLRYAAGNYTWYTGPAWIVKGGNNHTQLWFPDPVGTFSLQVGIVSTDPHGFAGLVLSKDSGTCSWNFSGVYNQNYYSSSYT